MQLHDDLVQALLHVFAVRLDRDLTIEWKLVRIIDAGEVGQPSGARFDMHSFRVSFLTAFGGTAHVNPDEIVDILSDFVSRRTIRADGSNYNRAPLRARSDATKRMRRTIVSRSSREKLRPFDRCRRITSPSRTSHLTPMDRRYRASSVAVVHYKGGRSATRRSSVVHRAGPVLVGPGTPVVMSRPIRLSRWNSGCLAPLRR